MMSTAVKGLAIEEARAVIRKFKSMMSIHESRLDGADGVEGSDPDAVTAEVADEDVELGDLEALQGVVKFPVRIKCATLAWNTLTQALDSVGAAAELARLRGKAVSGRR
jgi:nitrogen fixation NifU-like protein